MTKEQLAKVSANTKQTNFIGDLKKSLNPLYFIAFIIVFVLAFGLSAYETVFSLFSDHKFGFTPKDIAINHYNKLYLRSCCASIHVWKAGRYSRRKEAYPIMFNRLGPFLRGYPL